MLYRFPSNIKNDLEVPKASALKLRKKNGRQGMGGYC